MPYLHGCCRSPLFLLSPCVEEEQLGEETSRLHFLSHSVLDLTPLTFLHWLSENSASLGNLVKVYRLLNWVLHAELMGQFIVLQPFLCDFSSTTAGTAIGPAPDKMYTRKQESKTVLSKIIFIKSEIKLEFHQCVEIQCR